MNNLKHYTGVSHEIYEVQIGSVVEVFELPRRYTVRGQEVLCVAPQGILSQRIEESNMAFVRIHGQEYFPSYSDWLVCNQLESAFGWRPLWPAGKFIIMKSSVELREPWKPHTETEILQGKLMLLLSCYITHDLIYERQISVNFV